MKVRIGFVSNSSSSSFILDKSKITKEQLNAIRNHIEYFRENFPDDDENKWVDISDGWILKETDSKISGRTDMTNFSMEHFFNLIGVEGAKFKSS